MIVGWIAGCLSVSQLVPQILRLYKIKNAAQLSRWSLAARVLSHALYMLHAWDTPFDPPLFWMTLLGLILSLIVCAQISYYDMVCALVFCESHSSASMSLSTSSQDESSRFESGSNSSTSMGSGSHISGSHSAVAARELN